LRALAGRGEVRLPRPRWVAHSRCPDLCRDAGARPADGAARPAASGAAAKAARISDGDTPYLAPARRAPQPLRADRQSAGPAVSAVPRVSGAGAPRFGRGGVPVLRADGTERLKPAATKACMLASLTLVRTRPAPTGWSPPSVRRLAVAGAISWAG